MSATLPNKHSRIKSIKIVNPKKAAESDSDELTEFESGSDMDDTPAPKIHTGKKDDQQDASPLKRKRAASPIDLFDEEASESGQTSASLTEFDFVDLDDSEDDLDIERIENEALIQEEEDRSFLESKFQVVDKSQPFAFAVEDESDQASNTEEYWIEDFDALAGGTALFETASLPKFQLATEESQEALLEDDFFLAYSSSDEEGESVGGEEDEGSPFAQDGDDDRVGWECFFSDGESRTESEDEGDSNDGNTTDDEPIQKTVKLPPTTPAKTPAKTNLTSCLKKTHVTNSETPSKQIASTPIKLNTSHKPPVLGSWTRDNRLSTGIIDGITIHSPGDLPKTVTRPRSKSTIQNLPVDVVAEAMTSLDDIMYTNDFLLSDAEVQKAPASKFNKPIHVGAFRKGQARSSMLREDSLKDEWYTMTSRNKERSGRTKATPVLGVASESLSRKEKRRRRKMRSAAGRSVGGSTFGGSIDEQVSDNEYNDGIERAGLGLGPPVESLFLFHSY